MVSPKDVAAVFRHVGHRHNVPLGSLDLISGSELIVRYGIDCLGRARITLNRNQIDNERKLTALAEDIMSRLEEKLSPPQVKANMAYIETYRRTRAKASEIETQIPEDQDNAILLTLTATNDNPKDLKGNWDSFLSWLAVENECEVPEHIVAHRFTDKGREVIHALIFKEHIGNIEAVSNAARSFGFCRVVDLRAMERVEGQFLWRKANKGRGTASGDNVIDYFATLTPGVA